MILLFVAYQGDKIFELESIPWLSAISILTIISLMPADISLDGWMVNLISSENSSYGAVCQSIGFNLGLFLSFNLFLPLSSVEFCNSYIFSSPQTSAVIPVGPYIAILGVAIILFTAWIQFFFKEDEPITQSSGSFDEVVKTLKVFFLNKHFRKLFFIYCTWNLIFGPIHNLYPGLIMEKGVSKELFTNLNTPITPMLFIITIWLGALCKKHPETRVANTFWISRLLATFFIYATIVYLHIIPEEFKVPALFTASFLSSISFNGIAVALGAFASRVAKETYGGPVMSTFGAIGCFSRLVSDVFMFTLLNYLGWDNLALLTLGGMFLYAVFFIKGMNSFENQNLKSLLEPKVVKID